MSGSLQRTWLSDLPATPWKNGGGLTRELAISPAGAGLGGFDWRLSVAEVASDGPFSRFADVDRVLVLLSGAGMRLGAAGAEVLLDAPGARWDFAGELDVHGALVSGPTTDLNVMVRRGRASAEVHAVGALGRLRVDAGVQAVLVVGLGAGAAVGAGADALRVAAGEALLWRGAGCAEAEGAALSGAGVVVLVRA